MNKKLKLRLIDLRVSQYEIARDVGMTETRFSRIVRGRIAATPEERTAIALRLQMPVAELFDDRSDV